MMQNTLSAVIAAATLIGTAGAAPDVDNELVTSESGLADIVVTATRQSTKLQETPVAVTVHRRIRPDFRSRHRAIRR